MTMLVNERVNYYLLYQKIMGVEGLHHYEALIRREDDVSPAVFIPALEKTGKIAELDLLVLAMVLEDLRSHPHIKVAMNISPLSAYQSDFQKIFFEKLAEAGEDIVSRLSVEITETANIHLLQIWRVCHFLQQLKKRSIASYIDDYRGFWMDGWKLWVFTTASTVKVDSSILKKGWWSLLCATMIIRLNRKSIIVEGVQTSEQQALIKSLGKEFLFQGFLYGKAAPL